MASKKYYKEHIFGGYSIKTIKNMESLSSSRSNEDYGVLYQFNDKV